MQGAALAENDCVSVEAFDQTAEAAAAAAFHMH